MKTKYRIVTDKYLGYEAQFKPWFSPFWMQCFWTNTSNTIDGAKSIIQRHKNRVVYSET